MYHLVGIDVILGMDWLFKNHVIIDCKKRNVCLSLENENERSRLLFYGKEHASSMHNIFCQRIQASPKGMPRICCECSSIEYGTT